MGVVVRSTIQTVEDMYRLIRNAVMSRLPISALYDKHPRLLCPHRLGRNSAGHARVLCYQFGGMSSSGLEPSGSASNWRCMDVEKFSRIELWMASGIRPRTIPARKPASLMSMSTPKIIRTATDKGQTEGGRLPIPRRPLTPSRGYVLLRQRRQQHRLSESVAIDLARKAATADLRVLAGNPVGPFAV